MASGQWPPPPHTPQWQQAEEVTVSPSPAAYDLRPLSLGEILDRTFAVYRSRFWLFAGIGALSGSVQLIASAIQLSVYHEVRARFGLRAGLVETQFGNAIVTLLFLLAAAITQAATVQALSQVYLGRMATIVDAVRAVAGRWYRFVGITLWQAWSFLWLPLLLAVPGILLLIFLRGSSRPLYVALILMGALLGFVPGTLLFLRNSLGVQAAVVEELRVRPAMRRSKVLTAGAKGRIFVVFLIAWCLFTVAGMMEMPMSFLIVRAPFEEHTLAQISILLINFAAHTLVTPVALIGLSLVYFDQRVRQEALDLVLMLGGSPREVQPSPAPLPSYTGPTHDAPGL